MRSSIILSVAFAATAFSSPLAWQKRELDIETVYDVVYVTQVVTATAGAAAPATSTMAAVTSSSVAPVKLYFHRKKPSSTVKSSSTPAPAPSSVKVTTSIYVAPTTSAVTTSTPVAYTPSSSVASSGAAPLATNYQQRALLHHNIHRANHTVPDLVWDDSLAATAAGIAASCVYAHNVNYNGGGYGQNIAAGVKADNVSAVISDLFYNGEVGWYEGLYGQENPDMTHFDKWGHFSQIVWKGTTKVGCATQDCSAQGLKNVGQYVAPYFTVCNYEDPGNYGGEYADNVLASRGDPTMNWSYGI